MKSFKNRLTIGAILGIFLVFGVLVQTRFYSQNSDKVNKKVTSYLKNKEVAVTPTTVSSLSPTITQESLAVQTSGFCLRVPVLLYHHIQPVGGQSSPSVSRDIFDQQMAYLASSGYTAITAEQLVNALRTQRTLPPKSILITLDDGYRDVYDYAYPIFQKYHLNFNLMIIPGLIGGSDYLSWGQIGEMKGSGLAYFSNHTWSHYTLSRGPLDKVKFEIETAGQQLQDHIGQKIDVFTYPYGSFNNSVISVLQQDGFIGAFSTIPGFWQCDSFIFSLHRSHIGNAPLSVYGL